MQMTPWFPPGTDPVRNGVYITAESRMWGSVRSECWHAMRWDQWSRAWYSAESTGRKTSDLIGADRNNRSHFHWRGMLREPNTKRMRAA